MLRNQLRVEVASSEVGPSQVIPAVDFLVVAVRPTQREVVGDCLGAVRIVLAETSRWRAVWGRGDQ